MRLLRMTWIVMASVAAVPAVGNDTAAVVSRGYVAGDLPTPSCHASTIAESRPGEFIAAWFGGTAEGNRDVGIWTSHLEKGSWTAPVEAATGVQTDGRRWPCWNPVLFSPPGGGLLLFYKVGPSPSTWWGLVRSSDDGGRTWSPAASLAAAGTTAGDGLVGPIKNKPVALGNDALLAPSSTEGPEGWRVHFERSTDGGATWTVIGPVNDGKAIGAIQPSILNLGAGRLLALGRTRTSRRIFRIESEDGGHSWGEMSLTDLPNPNSGTDAVTLADGRHLLVYNHTPQGRTPLNVAVSSDGRSWIPVMALETEPGEFSYPAIIQAADGHVHVTYTWNRKKIAHVEIDPAKILVARRRLDLVDRFGSLATSVGMQDRDRIQLVSGPDRVTMLNDETPGRCWQATLGTVGFRITIQDATGLEVEQVVEAIERMPPAYRPALAVVSEPGKAGIAFYKDLDGAAAHGSQDYLNVVPGIDTAVLLHESGHVLEQRYRTVHADVLEEWGKLIPEDGISVSEYGDHVAHEDLAEFAMVYGLCLDAGEPQLADLRRFSPRRFALWQAILEKAPHLDPPAKTP